MPIEQAIFTSARTAQLEGYQLVGASAGLSDADARELIAWGPSHDSLLPMAEETGSVNFHPLPSGAYCIAKTLAAGAEYSGRGGARVYTQCLIVPADILNRFGANPFALLRAAWAKGMLRIAEDPTLAQPSFTLAGRSPAVDEGLLAQWAERLGSQHAGWLVQSVCDQRQIMVAGAENPEHLVSGLLMCLPVDCRRDLTFATGLKHSLRRPYRLIFASADATERHHLQRQAGLHRIDLSANPPRELRPEGWGACVAQAIRSDRLHLLSEAVHWPHAGEGLSQLDPLAAALRTRLAASEAAEVIVPRASIASRPDHQRALTSERSPPQRMPRDGLVGPTAERIDQGVSPPRAGASVLRPVNVDSPAVLSQLEELDDLVYEAMTGNQQARDRARLVWPMLQAELNADLIEQTREQYLRSVMAIWDEFLSDGSRDPRRAIAALDVLGILFGEPAAR